MLYTIGFTAYPFKLNDIPQLLYNIQKCYGAPPKITDKMPYGVNTWTKFHHYELKEVLSSWNITVSVVIVKVKDRNRQICR